MFMYEATLQTVVSETLTTCLLNKEFMAGCGLTPNLHRHSFSPPSNLQNVETGEYPLDLAQEFIDRPPLVLENKVIKEGHSPIQLRSPNDSQALALEKIAALGSTIHLCYNTVEEFTGKNAVAPITWGDGLRTAPPSSYTRWCRLGQPPPAHTTKSLPDLLEAHLKKTPPKNFKPHLALLAFDGDILREYSKLNNKRERPSFVGIIHGDTGTRMYSGHEFRKAHDFLRPHLIATTSRKQEYEQAKMEILEILEQIRLHPPAPAKVPQKRQQRA
jgi:hypothetical protein